MATEIGCETELLRNKQTVLRIKFYKLCNKSLETFRRKIMNSNI